MARRLPTVLTPATSKRAAIVGPIFFNPSKQVSLRITVILTLKIVGLILRGRLDRLDDVEHAAAGIANAKVSLPPRLVSQLDEDFMPIGAQSVIKPIDIVNFKWSGTHLFESVA